MGMAIAISPVSLSRLIMLRAISKPNFRAPSRSASFIATSYPGWRIQQPLEVPIAKDPEQPHLHPLCDYVLGDTRLERAHGHSEAIKNLTFARTAKRTSSGHANFITKLRAIRLGSISDVEPKEVAQTKSRPKVKRDDKAASVPENVPMENQEWVMDDEAAWRLYLPNNEELPKSSFEEGVTVYFRPCETSTNDDARQKPKFDEVTFKARIDDGTYGVGKVRKKDTHFLYVQCSGGFEPQEDVLYDIDIGFDDSLLARREVALAKCVQHNTLQQRQENESFRNHPFRQQVELSGSELVEVICQVIPSPCYGRRPSRSLDWRSDLWENHKQLAEALVDLNREDDSGSHQVGSIALDPSQRAAIDIAIRNRLSLIQGPPGTGKTNTIVGLVSVLKQKAGVNEPIMVTAHTHLAIEAIAEKCLLQGMSIVRFGDTTKPDLEHHTLKAQLLVDPDWPEVQQYLDIMEELRIRRSDLERIGQELRKPKTQRNMDKWERTWNKKAVITAIDQVKSDYKQALREMIRLRKPIEHRIIHGADVCFSTCLGFGGSYMSTVDFPVVIVDEATQCDVGEVLMPLVKGSRHLVLVGDHKQLGSICCEAVKKKNLHGSLFELFINASARLGVPRSMLTVQYRMKPAISALPNEVFYKGRLQDSQERQEATLGQQAKDMVTFLTHRHREENALKGHSIGDPGEASIVFQCVQELIRIGWLEGRSEADVLRTTGITTPYKEQAKVLLKLAKEKYGNDCELEIATVDTFQGRDKEFMIISTVRSSPSGSPGHTGDPRRTCVALTRARNRLYIIGNPDTLRKDQWKLWARLLDWYTKMGCVVEASEYFKPKKTSANTAKETPVRREQLTPSAGVAVAKQPQLPAPVKKSRSQTTASNKPKSWSEWLPQYLSSLISRVRTTQT